MATPEWSAVIQEEELPGPIFVDELTTGPLGRGGKRTACCVPTPPHGLAVAHAAAEN
jgi:hypothetical protein